MKDFIRTITVSTFLWLLCSCSKDASKEVGLAELEAQGEFLSAEQIASSDDLLLASFDLKNLEGALLICKSYPSPNYYEVLDLNTFSHIGGFGKQGSGPGEFAGILRTSVKGFDPPIVGVTSNAMGLGYYEINVDSALRSSAYMAKKIVELDETGLNRVQRDNMGRFITLNLNSPNRVLLFDSIGKNPKGYFDYPFLEEMSEVRTEVYGIAYQAKMVRNHEKDLVGVFAMGSPNWDIYSFSNEKPELVSSHHLRAMGFRDLSEVGESFRSYSVAKSSDNKRGFIDITANDKFIYTLYSGESYAKVGDNVYFSNKLVILDWQGDVVANIDLEFNTRVISVDRKGEYLYSIVEEQNGSRLVRYNVKDLLQE